MLYMQALRSVVQMLKEDSFQPDLFCVAQILRCGTYIRVSFLRLNLKNATENFYIIK
jgi:6-phosphogluconate dehydrogenase (decarboxylating)